MTQTREEWLRERKRGIGGSEVQHVFSEAPYGCARRLWFDKRDVAQDYPDQETPPMQRGTLLEDLVARLYSDQSGRKVRRRKAITSKARPWERVNIDREILGDPRGPGVLEVKTHNFWVFRKVKQEGLQSAHILQLQWALGVTGNAWGSYAILHPDSWQLIWFDVPRDDELIASIQLAGEKFWRMVEHGPMPDPLPTIDRRCATCPWRKTCRGEALIAAANIPQEDLGEKIPRDESLAEVIADYKEAARMAEEANDTLEVVKGAIKARMGDRVAVECEGARIYFRKQVSMRLDTKALESKYPEAAKECRKPSESRPLRVVTY